jgi:hypothetical protein
MTDRCVIVHYTATFGPLDPTDRRSMNRAHDQVAKLNAVAVRLGFHDFSADEETVPDADSQARGEVRRG